MYKLPEDEHGLGKPYTAIQQYGGTKFLMKEDDKETNLYLMDFNAQKNISSYHCALRDKKETSYTPYDFIFDFAGDIILLAYCYLDRYEILQIDGDMMIPVFYLGEKDYKTIPSNYDDLKYTNLCIRAYGKNFLILKSHKGTEESDIISIINIESKSQKTIYLNKKIKLFDVDDNGNIWGYNETSSGSIIYQFKTNETGYADTLSDCSHPV